MEPKTSVALAPEALEQVAILSAKGLSPSAISKVLKLPTSKIANALRTERRKIALILFQRSIDPVIDLTERHLALAQKVLSELEKRSLQDMTVAQLNHTMGTLGKWNAPIAKYLFLSEPTVKKDDQAKPTVNIEQLMMLVDGTHQTQQRIEEEKRRRAILSQDDSDDAVYEDDSS